MKNPLEYKNSATMRPLLYLLIVCFLGLLYSCSKQNEWLEAKVNKSSVVPQTLEDFQALLDNSNQIMNLGYSTIGLVGSDNIVVNETNLARLSEVQRNAYTWNKDIYTGASGYEWSSMYAVIGHANVVIEGLSNIDPNQPKYNNIKGQAHFFRAYAYYNLAQVYCKPYSGTASSDPGLPIRVSADVNKVYPRASVEKTYDQILTDAKIAASLLEKQQLYTQRPNSSAANALVAKAYLNIEDYSQAESYADLSLADHNVLLDFNSNIVDLKKTLRFPAYSAGNPEILFYAESNMYFPAFPSATNPASISPELYGFYDTNDLRKTVFYSTAVEPRFVGAYTGRAYTFCGIAVNEVYLIRSESRARLGNFKSSMDDLNVLLQKRYKTGSFIPRTAVNAEEALNVILVERRKELPMVSNIRWEDLRRLNKDARFQKTLTRVLNGVTYTLPPNDKRYLLPIPIQEILLSGIQQNER